MATTLVVANISIPNIDSQSNPINYNTLAEGLAALAVDSSYYTGSMYKFDTTGTYQGQSTVITVFLLAANSAAALTLYTNFKNSLPGGTFTNVWYSTQTLGV